MNILKIIRTAYQKGKLSLEQLIQMELMVASHCKSIMKNSECPERKYLRETYLKGRLMQSQSIFVHNLLGVFMNIIILIGFIGLVILIFS